MQPVAEPTRAQLLEFARERLGELQRVEDLSRVYGRRSIVLRLSMAGQESAYLKHHVGSQLYEREVHALERWTPLLPPAARASTTRLLAKSDGLQAVLLSEVPGVLANVDTLTPAERTEAFRQAGAFLAAVHDLDVDDEGGGFPDGYASFVVAQLERRLELAGEMFDAPFVRWVRAVVGVGEMFEESRIVATHSDYSPRNWLVDRRDGALHLGVIDWERSRIEHWLIDAQRMLYDDWADHPELREAFFDGYGRRLSPEEARQLELLALTQGIAFVRWARDVGDRDWEAFNRAMLERLRREL